MRVTVGRQIFDGSVGRRQTGFGPHVIGGVRGRVALDHAAVGCHLLKMVLVVVQKKDSSMTPEN